MCVSNLKAIIEVAAGCWLHESLHMSVPLHGQIRAKFLKGPPIALREIAGLEACAFISNKKAGQLQFNFEPGLSFSSSGCSHRISLRSTHAESEKRLQDRPQLSCETCQDFR